MLDRVQDSSGFFFTNEANVSYYGQNASVFVKFQFHGATNSIYNIFKYPVATLGEFT
jgi:hypothetical protein